MVLKVYVTNIGSQNKIKKEILHVTDVLDSMKIDYEPVDIANPNFEEEKKFMRLNAKPKDGQANPLPPQIFSDDEYLGNYDDFFCAVESNKIYEFLKMADKIETSTAEIEDDCQQEQTQDVEPLD